MPSHLSPPCTTTVLAADLVTPSMGAELNVQVDCDVFVSQGVEHCHRYDCSGKVSLRVKQTSSFFAHSRPGAPTRPPPNPTWGPPKSGVLSSHPHVWSARTCKGVYAARSSTGSPELLFTLFKKLTEGAIMLHGCQYKSPDRPCCRRADV